ncbi:MAG: hypothetical protein ABJB86_20025 [Bacteroidota bacterium]
MSSVLPIICSGQSIGNWTFNNVLTGTPGLHNVVSLADFSSSVPIHSFNGGTEYYGENGWPSGAVNTAMYMEFSLTPSTGYQLDISTLVLTMRRSNTGSPAGSGPATWSLRSSLDGFTSNIASSSMTLTYANYTVTPGSSFLNLYSTTTFRLYGYNASIGSGGNSRFVIDNITVNGLGYLLPVKLGLLHATLQEEKVNLSYTAYNTEANARYLIERSSDGINYVLANTVTEANTAAEKNYNYIDDVASLNSSSELFYRLHTISSSGTHTFSETVVIRKKIISARIKIYVTNNQLHINGAFPAEGIYHAVIYGINGQVIINVPFNASTGNNAFIVNIDKKIPLASVIQISNSKGYLSSLITVNR